MAKLHPIQRSFSSGELSPKLSARHDLERMVDGLEECTNMIPLRHGPIQRRGGTVFVDQYAGETTGKLFTFHVSPSQSFTVAVLDNGTLVVSDPTGQILDDNLVLNPYFDSGLTDWIENSDANAGVVWANGVAGFGSSQIGRFARLQQLIDTSALPNTVHEVRILGAPGTFDSRLKLDVGTTQGGVEIDTTEFVQGISSFQFDPAGATAVWLSFTFEGIAPLTGFWSLDTVTCAAVGGTGVEFAHPWEFDDIADMQAEMPPGEDVMFFTSPRVAQQELSFNKAANTWAFAPITFTLPPASWTAENFPSCVTFFQGRSWWGGTPDQGATFWASKSGIIRDMTQGTVADDGMELEISRRGRIEWMEGVKNLLVGTENGEFVITSEAGIIEPGDIEVEQQSSYGSNNSEARPIGNDVLYLSADGAKLRKATWEWTQEGWLSADLTWLGEHLPAGSPIREVHYVKDPESIIACISASGEVYTCTYDPDTTLVGWARMNTIGRVISATVTQQRGSSVLWVLVDRRLDDPTQFFLERFSLGQTSPDFLDSSIVNLNEPISNVAGPALHLANTTVSVSVDGATHPDIALDGSGLGTLDFDGARIVVGQKYVSKIRTFPYDPGAPSGSGLGMNKRWNRLIVRVLNSALPLVNGQRQPDRTPASPMDITEPNRSEDIRTRQLGWDEKAQVEIEQDLPRPLTVTAIFGEMSEESL